MAGLINDTQNSSASAEETAEGDARKDSAEEEATEGGRRVSAQSVRSQMVLPPGQEEVYQRIVAAGKKLLFSEQMAPEIKALLDGPGDMGTKIGQGVVALMAILVTKSNGTLPPQLILPAACELVAEAGDLLEDAGYEVTDQDVAEGVAIMVQEILQRAGVDPEQLPQLLGAGGPQPSPQAPPTTPDGVPMENV